MVNVQRPSFGFVGQPGQPLPGILEGIVDGGRAFGFVREVRGGPFVGGRTIGELALPDIGPIVQRAGVEPVVWCLAEVADQPGEDAVEIDRRGGAQAPAASPGAASSALSACEVMSLLGATQPPVCRRIRKKAFSSSGGVIGISSNWSSVISGSAAHAAS